MSLNTSKHLVQAENNFHRIKHQSHLVNSKHTNFDTYKGKFLEDFLQLFLKKISQRFRSVTSFSICRSFAYNTECHSSAPGEHEPRETIVSDETHLPGV